MSLKTKAMLPFHLFQLDGKHYVINIEKMAASAVDDLTAETLKRISAEPEEPLLPGLTEDLGKLELLVQDEKREFSFKEPETFPIVSMALFVTRACNLRCTYCYEEKSGGSMEEKTAFRAVDWLLMKAGSAKQIYISFFGGEPFLNFPLIKKVAVYAREKAARLAKEVSFNVTTNATLLNDEMIQFLKEQNVRTLVSMDGPKEIQDTQRPFPDGRGSYDVVLPRVRKLLEAMPETRVHAVLVDDSKAERMKSTLQDIGFPEVTLLPASASLFDKEGDGGGAKQARKLDNLLQEMEREAESWLHLFKRREKSTLKALRSGAQLLQAMLALLHNKKMRYACGAGIKYVAVSCNGDIYLCHRFVGVDEYKLGNVFEAELRGEEYQESPLTRVPACAACFARYYCAGGCKHDHAGSCGSAWSPSPDMCALKRRELELASALIGRLDDQDRAFLIESEIIPPKPCPLDF